MVPSKQRIVTSRTQLSPSLYRSHAQRQNNVPQNRTESLAYSSTLIPVRKTENEDYEEVEKLFYADGKHFEQKVVSSAL